MHVTRKAAPLLGMATLAALALTAPRQAHAQLLVDPTGGTTLFDSTTNHDDQVASNQSLGFTLNYFGTSHTTVDVSTNGNLNFSGDSAYTNTALPNGPARISPYWDDLYIFQGQPASITSRQGPGYYAVTWTNLGDYGRHQLNGDTFQAVIFGSDVTLGGLQFHPNDIAFSYSSLFTSNDGSVTVGLNAGDGTNFVTASGTPNGIITDPHSVPTNDGSILRFRYDGSNGYSVDVAQAAAVPEPASWAAFGVTGLFAAGLILKARRRPAGAA